MSEAKDLTNTPAPAGEGPAANDPPVFTAGAESGPAVALPGPGLGDVVPKTAHAVPAPKGRSFSRKVFNVLLILSLVGILGFAGGVAVAMAGMSGMLDAQSGWAKEMLGNVKELVQHFKK